MAAPIGKWRTRTGVHVTTAGRVLSVDVDVEVPAGEDGCDRVEFSISENGGAPTVVTVSAESLRTPNYNTAPSPIPGAGTTTMAPFPGWGIDLALDDWDVGTITVSATVYTVVGTPRVVPDGPITVYNDRDGTDRRPNPNTLYVNQDTGSDANPGTIGSQKATVPGAMDALRLLAAGNDLAGAKIIVGASATPYPWMGVSMGFNWQTTGHWPLTIECADGVIWQRDTVVNQFFNALGNGAGTRCYVHWLGSGSASAARWEGIHCDVYIGTGVEYVEWQEGIRAGSRFWADGKCTVRYYEKAEAGAAFTKTQTSVSYRKYANCCRVQGVGDGYTDYTDTQDCTIQDFVTLAFGGGGYNGLTSASGMTYSALNCLGWNGRVTHPDQLGWCDTIVGAGEMVATIPSAGQLRIDATATLYATKFGLPGTDWPVSLATFEELIASSEFQVKVSGWTGNNGKYTVLSTGTNGSGFPYVVLSVPSGSSGACPASARIQTEWTDARLAELGIGTFDPHGGLDHMFGAGFHDSIRRSVVFYDIVNMQGPFIECPQDRCAWVDYALASTQLVGDLNVPWYGTATTNSVIRGCSWSADFQVNCTMTNCVVVDNVFRQAGGTVGLPAHGSGGNEVHDNHFVFGSTYGANPSTGTFFQNDPGSAPWSFEPDFFSLDTGSSPDQPETRWDGATARSRGCSRFTGLQDWSLAGGPSGETGDAFGFLPMFGAAETEMGPIGAVFGFLPMFGEGAAEIDVSGATSGFLPLFGDSFGRIDAVYGASGTLPLFGDATGSTGGMVGAAGGALPLFGDASLDRDPNSLDPRPGTVTGAAGGFLPLWGQAASIAWQTALEPGLRQLPLVVGNISRIIRAPGRIVIAPVGPLNGGEFPYGGTEIGRANLCALQPLGEAYRVENEGLGEVGDILEAGNRWVFSCFLRGWDDRALERLLQDGFARGDVTQHAVFSAPGTQVAGRTALGRAVRLLFVPDDLVHVPGVLLYQAVPDWTDGSEIAFRRGSELGLPLTFECVRDLQGRILQVGRLADLDIDS